MDVRSRDDSNTAVDSGPFDFAPQRQDKNVRRGVLLLHGFTGTPYEMRFLGEKLAARGLRAVGPTLRGHGGTPDELATTTYRDWIAGADAALSKLRRECDRVAVAGLSLGGLIALDVAKRNPDLAALVCLAVPLWLPRATTVGIHAASILVKRLPKIGGSDIRDSRAKKVFPTFSAFPIAPLKSLMDLQARIRPQIPSIKIPTLVMHADQDHVAPAACARELYERLGCPKVDKRLVRLPESYHIITVDVEREIVAREVGDFIKERM